MFSDLKFAIRTWTKAPWLTAVIVLSLAIGIGANTVIFSWLKAEVLQPLPGVAAPVLLIETKDDTGNYVSTSWLEYEDVRRMLPSFESIAAHRGRALFLGDAERGTRVFAEYVSGNFFRLLDVRPQLGRFFTPDEATTPGSAPVAVISDEFWRQHFNGTPDVVGQPLMLNGRTLTVIGVAPRGFLGAMNNLAFDLWVPLTMASELIPASSELTTRTNRAYFMLGRLKPGTTLAQAQGELATAAREMIATHPETNQGLAYALLPLWRSPRGGEMAVVLLASLQAFAVLILIVVCTNTANLLLARASTRQREIGVKLAIGAGPGRLIFQLLTESVVLALIGASAGLVVALWSADALRQIPVPGNMPVRLPIAIDWTSLLFAAGLGTACGVMFGVAPAWQLARSDVLKALRGGRGAMGGRSRLRDVLVGLEVGVALVVLVLAALFGQSFRNALGARPGFDPDRVMLASLDLGGRGYNGKTGGALLDDLIQRLEQMPGVERAAAANYVPLDLRGVNTGVISIAGEDFDPNRKIVYYYTTAGYFATMGMPFVEGGDLTARARSDLPLDAVINAEMAKRYWPGTSAVGRRFEVDGSTFVVAGVVRDSKLEKLTELPRPAAWLSMRTQFVSGPTLHVRAKDGDPRALLSAIRATVQQVDPGLVMLDTRSLAQHIENNLFIQRVPAQMLAILGPLALALAAIGLYAVLAYSVAQRTQEIGVRLTLGATPGSVVRLVIWQSMRVVLASALVGWLVALGAGWYLRGSFVGVTFGAPLIYAGVPAILIAVALIACWVPAQRAAKVDPISALRAE